MNYVVFHFDLNLKTTEGTEDTESVSRFGNLRPPLVCLHFGRGLSVSGALCKMKPDIGLDYIYNKL